MKTSTLLKISTLAGLVAVGAAAYKKAGKYNGAALTEAGCAEVLAKGEKPVGIIASVGIEPHTTAEVAARACGWICVTSAKEAIRKRGKAARGKR